MKLSIIIPTFNSERLIKRCLESIIGQTMGDFEVLIMDGVSSDKTLALIAELNDSRIKVFSEPDDGIYDAMNKGIEKAHGEWLYFMGSDDYLLNPDVLKNVSSQLADDYDVLYGEVESDLSDKNRGEWTMETLEYNRCHQAIFYKRSLFDKIGKYPLKYKVGADHDLNLKWFLNPEIKNVFINQKIAHFSSGGFSKEQGDDGFFDEFYINMIRQHFCVIPIGIKISFLEKAILHTSNIIYKVGLKIQLYIVRIYKKVFC